MFNRWKFFSSGDYFMNQSLNFPNTYKRNPSESVVHSVHGIGMYWYGILYFWIDWCYCKFAFPSSGLIRCLRVQTNVTNVTNGLIHKTVIETSVETSQNLPQHFEKEHTLKLCSNSEMKSPQRQHVKCIYLLLLRNIWPIWIKIQKPTNTPGMFQGIFQGIFQVNSKPNQYTRYVPQAEQHSSLAGGPT